MTHPLVDQLRFTRREFRRGLRGLTDIDKLFAFGAPASTPALEEMWAAWKTIPAAADPWLDTLTVEKLQEHVVRKGQASPYLFGSLLQRVIYHYWYHLGENMAIQQVLGHQRLAQFVGNLDGQAPYTPEGRTVEIEGND